MIKKLIIVAIFFLLSGCVHLRNASPPLLNGECPEDFSIKGNHGNSGWIYHTTKSPYYVRVNPEWCFSDVDTAHYFGYRKFRTYRAYGR
jgi:hypothetical protein